MLAGLGGRCGRTYNSYIVDVLPYCIGGTIFGYVNKP